MKKYFKHLLLAISVLIHQGCANKYSELEPKPILKKENKAYIEFLKYDIINSDSLIFKVNNEKLEPIVSLSTNQKYTMEVDKGKYKFFIIINRFQGSIVEIDIKENKTHYVDLSSDLLYDNDNIKTILQKLAQKGCNEDILYKFDFYKMPNLVEDSYTFRKANALEVVCDENEKLRKYTKLQNIPSLDIIDKMPTAMLSKEGKKYFDENLALIQKVYNIYNKIWDRNFISIMVFGTIKYLELSIPPNNKNLKEYTSINIISNPKNKDEKKLIDAISKYFKSYNGNKKLDIEIIINRLDSGSWLRRYVISSIFGFFSTRENYYKGISSANLDINYYDNKEKIASLNFAHYTGITGIINYTISITNKEKKHSYGWSFLGWINIPTMKRDTIETIEDFTLDNFLKDK